MSEKPKAVGEVDPPNMSVTWYGDGLHRCEAVRPKPFKPIKLYLEPYPAAEAAQHIQHAEPLRVYPFLIACILLLAASTWMMVRTAKQFVAIDAHRTAISRCTKQGLSYSEEAHRCYRSVFDSYRELSNHERASP